MKDSLGGRAKTLMFVNISPADWNAQESLNSLQFGQRVKMVQNDVSRNIETDTTKRLKAEIQELKKRLGEWATLYYNHTKFIIKSQKASLNY